MAPRSPGPHDYVNIVWQCTGSCQLRPPAMSQVHAGRGVVRFQDISLHHIVEMKNMHSTYYQGDLTGKCT